MAPSSPFVLETAMTVDDWEQVFNARARATGIVWAHRLVAAFLVFVGVRSGLDSDLFGAVVFTGLGLALATGVWQRTFRQLLFYRRNPHLLGPTRDVVDAAGVRSEQNGAARAYGWDMWQSCLVLDDMALLATSPKGNAQVLPLLRRGLSEPARWDELTHLIASQVPVSPRSPVKPSV